MSLLLAVGSTGVEVNATRQSLILTTYPANVALDIDVTTTRQVLVLTTYQANISLDLNINVTAQALVLTQHPANVALDINVNATVHALALTSYQSNVSLDINVQVTTQALSLVAYPAVVDFPVSVPIAEIQRGISGGSKEEEHVKKKRKRKRTVLYNEVINRVIPVISIDIDEVTIHQENTEITGTKENSVIDNSVSIADFLQAKEISTNEDILEEESLILLIALYRFAA